MRTPNTRLNRFCIQSLSTHIPTPTTITTIAEGRVLVIIVQYYRYNYPRRSHILSPLTEVSAIPKGRKILCNDALEELFKDINCMVSGETLLNY